MERYTGVRLDLWREACRHIEIGESLERIAPILRQRLPAAAILVRRIDGTRAGVETVAVDDERGRPGLAQRSELPPNEMEALLAWCRAGGVSHAPARELTRRVPGLLPGSASGDVLAGPLAADGGAPAGLLVLLARRGDTFRPDHAALLRACLDPFAVALENDGRLREVQRLREAAEADREALLSRLGRREMGETIVGAGSGLRLVMERVHLVASLDVPVLILGETGAGKEVVARAIHAGSARASGPFLRVNCGAIPAGLIDSELFGHERGSFTGAVGERKGWFERADHGTLFLDEIGELPPDAQVRLLRVLQDGTLERVGGHRTLSVDVRIVAATHRDLPAMIAERRFREDLWYRIAVFPIHLPPLRDRVEDIPALATHFALRAATRFGTPAMAPSPADVDLLVRYPWPGNVRELGAVMERAVILGDGRRLDVARALGPVPAPAAGLAPTPLRVAAPGPPLPTAGDEDFATLDGAMARHIEAALLRTRGRIEGLDGAGALLGINPHTLRARMRKLGVDWRRFRGRRAR